MNGFPMVDLSEVLDFREGPGILAVDFHDSGVPLIRLAGLKRGASILSGCDHLDPVKVARKWDHFRLELGDVLLSTSASLGEVAVVKEDGVGAVPYTGIIRFRPSDDRVDASFIEYMLRSSYFAQQVAAMGVGSVMKHFGPSHLRQMRVPLPPVDVQRAIAEVLGTLDDKIAANARVAALADKCALAMFEAFAARVSGTKTLGEVATLVLGGTPSRAREEFWTSGDVPWLNSGKANEARVIAPSELITQAALSQSSTKMMPVGATLLAITGATLGQVARLEIEACGNQSLIGAWGSTLEESDWLHFAIRRAIPDLLRSATGAAQQHVNKGAVSALRVLFEPDVARAFGEKVRPLLQLAAQADRETEQLARTRDALLPGLMSGAIRVKDAEKSVEEVV